MPDIIKKIIKSVVLSVPSALLPYILQRVFQAWGIFDPFSKWLGGWLKVHVTPFQIEWTVAGILALLGYAALLWWVWNNRVPPLVHHDIAVKQPLRPTSKGAERDTNADMVVNTAAPFTETATVPIAGLEKIYQKITLSDRSLEFRLRFLPDTKDYEIDSLIAICYLYKYICGIVEISSSFVDNQVKDLVLKAPNSRLTVLQKMGALVALATMNPDIGRKAIDRGYVQRVGLASGGQYKLTPEGEVRAKAIICDMMNQA